MRAPWMSFASKNAVGLPQWLHMNATRPGPPANGAISATFDIGSPHHLQAFSDTTFIVLPLELGLF